MADNFTKRQRSYIMSRIRGKNTKPELALRKMLLAEGYRYRLHYGRYKIDIAMPNLKIAIFVDGCFWHKCQKHFRMPKSNIGFWRKKIHANAVRDKETVKSLRAAGWKVVRVWEHDLRIKPKMVACRIKNLVKHQRYLRGRVIRINYDKTWG